MASRWDEERRAALRAELDAFYAHLYGLTREELGYIPETRQEEGRREVRELQDEGYGTRIL